ncbi:MAG: precorrin-2 C(20)-methyltransferase [Nitrospirae bacterium]|nr:precorrin-2 C(20)-methyltransferase [Nitrospirota bacterium]
MTGKLYVIGVGPGDPELMTLKAVRILKETPCIFVPKGREEGSSLALSIVRKELSLEGKELVELHFPMMKTAPHPGPLPGGERENVDGPILRGEREFSPAHELDSKWNEAVHAIVSVLEQGSDAAFITIGDPGIYSTFFYLYDKLLERIPALAIEIIPGISSINAAAARAGLSLGLGNERIAILPANYLDSLEETLEKFDTVVLMKVSKVFNTVRDMLNRMNRAAQATYVVRAGMDDERVYKDIGQVNEEDTNYFSLMIVRKR